MPPDAGSDAIRPLRCPVAEGLEGLSFARDELPFGYTGAPASARAAHAAARAVAVLAGEGVRAFGAGSPPDCVVAYRPLPWDSERLGLETGALELLGGGAEAPEALPGRARRAGRADATEGLIDAALGAARDGGAAYVTARVDAGAPARIHALESRGFQVVDSILRMSRGLAGELPTDARAPVVRDARPEDLDALRRIARSAFHYDRFHTDPVVADEAADAVHADWIENGVRGRTGCGVLLAERGGGPGNSPGDSPVGFVLLGEEPRARDTLGFGVGSVTLVAVDATRRRSGVGSALTRAALLRLRERGNRYVEVGTQLANVAASNLYLRAGFRPTGALVTLRWRAGER